MHRQTRFSTLSRIPVILGLLICIIPCSAQTENHLKNVVVFFAFGPNLPAFEKILEGLNSSIRGGTDEPVNIMTEYFDMTRTGNDEYSKFIIDLYSDKLKEVKIDLLITVGPEAIEMGARYTNADFTDENISGGTFGRFTTAVGWYPNAHFRFEINYGHGLLDKDALTGISDFWQFRAQFEL